MAPTLPVELVLIVLSHIEHPRDRNAFVKYMLVDDVFRCAAASRLFKTLKLPYTVDYLKRDLAMLKSFPDIVKNVTSVVLHPATGFAYSEFRVDCTVLVLPALPRCHALCITNGTWTGSSLHSIVPLEWDRLRVLVLTQTTISTETADLALIAHQCSALTKLVLDNVYFHGAEDFSLADVRQLRPDTKLNTLHVHAAGATLLHHVDRILHVVRSSLKELHLTVDFRQLLNGAVNSTLEHIGRCTSLRHLSYGACVPALDWLNQTIIGLDTFRDVSALLKLPCDTLTLFLDLTMYHHPERSLLRQVPWLDVAANVLSYTHLDTLRVVVRAAPCPEDGVESTEERGQWIAEELKALQTDNGVETVRHVVYDRLWGLDMHAPPNVGFWDPDGDDTFVFFPKS